MLRICLNKRRKPTYDFSSALSARIMSTGSSTVEFASDCALRRQQARLKLRLGPLCAVKERARHVLATPLVLVNTNLERKVAPGAALELSNKTPEQNTRNGPHSDTNGKKRYFARPLLSVCSARTSRARSRLPPRSCGADGHTCTGALLELN